MSIVNLPPQTITRLGISYLPQVGNVFTNFMVKENLLMAGYILDKKEAKERAKEVLEIFPRLKGYMKRKAGFLSGGEEQMLAMAMAMTRRPKVMLFDEPTGSLAPKIALEVLDKILALRDEYGMTVLLQNKTLEEL